MKTLKKNFVINHEFRPNKNSFWDSFLGEKKEKE